MEEICSSKCQEEYMECSSTCEGPECLSDCNRESIACTDCKLQFKIAVIIKKKTQNVKRVHVIPIVLLDAKDVEIQFVFAM